jgi:hypothetical protein
LVTNVTNSSNLVGLTNEVISGSASMADMIAVLNGITPLAPVDGDGNPTDTTELIKMVALVNNLTAADEGLPGCAAGATCGSAEHTLVAELMAPTGVCPAVGLGSANMITLVNELGICDTGTEFSSAACGGTWTPEDTTSSVLLAAVMNGLNTNLCYNEDCAGASLARASGMVRLVVPGCGVAYDPSGLNVAFPGLGPAHLALMMNQAAEASDLLTLMNGVNLADMLVVVACGDHVPGFLDECDAIGQGW